MLQSCLYCKPSHSLSESRIKVLGHYVRKSDHKKVIRYKCSRCKRTFSQASLERCVNQKKRQINSQVYQLLCSGVSQRRSARVLNVNRKTIARKLIFLGIYCEALLRITNLQFEKSKIVEFDDLETFEHSKCKPLSVTMAVEHKSRRILGFKVSRMPAKGLLAAISRKKYGKRPDERPKARQELFEELTDLVDPKGLFKSDQHPGYPKDLKQHFPSCQHKAYKSRRACVVGQGELKEGKFDPLFSLNHSFAMLRANINRLFRRSWNTTKKPEMLKHHLSMYGLYHNLVLIKKP